MRPQIHVHTRLQNFKLLILKVRLSICFQPFHDKHEQYFKSYGCISSFEQLSNSYCKCPRKNIKYHCVKRNKRLLNDVSLFLLLPFPNVYALTNWHIHVTWYALTNWHIHVTWYALTNWIVWWYALTWPTDVYSVWWYMHALYMVIHCIHSRTDVHDGIHLPTDVYDGISCNISMLTYRYNISIWACDIIMLTSIVSNHRPYT